MRVGEKATALWAGLFIRLDKLTGDKTHLTAGTNALQWCMDVVVTYTVALFGNALAEALSLDELE